MFNQPKKEPSPTKPYVGQLDQLINKQLYSSLAPINFRLIGSSNGIIIDNLFPHKTMVYINAINGNDELVFELIVAALQNVSPIIKKIPLVYSGNLSKIKIQKVSDILKVQVQMQQCPVQQLILAVKISILFKNAQETEDTLSILVLNPEQIKKPSLKMLHLLKIKCGDTCLNDFAWHPLSNLTLLVLTSLQVIEIWNFNDQDFLKPAHTIRLKSLKLTYSLNSQIKFKCFATINKDKNLQTESKINGRWDRDNNKYALFVMNQIGELVSIFPFLPVGSSITRQQYDYIYDIQQNLTKQKMALSAYLNNCTLGFNDQDSTYTITGSPALDSHYLMQKWYKNGRMIKITEMVQMSKQQKFYHLKLFPLSQQCLLVIQVVHRVYASTNCIILSMINKQVEVDDSIEVDNVIYEIAEIRNDINNKNRDVRFIISDSKANQIGLSKFKSLFYTQANGLYKIDLSAVFDFVQTNDIKHIQGEDPFPITLIFQLNQIESISALAVEQSLNNLNFVRRSNNKSKFQIQPLGYVNAFSQIQNISKASNQLIKKLNNLKVDSKPKPNQEKDKKSQLQMTPQQLKQFQEKGIQSLKKYYARYSDNIKNSIDQGMSKLKSNYEIMRKKLKLFDTFKQKRNQMDKLLQIVQSNNEDINKLLYEQDKTKQNIKSQSSQMQRSINSLMKLLEGAKQKELSIDKEAQKTMGVQLDYLSQKLKLVRSNLEQAKRLKKEIKDHQNS